MLDNTCACGTVEPVGVCGGYCAGGIQILAHADAVELRVTVCAVVPVIEVAQVVGVRVLSFVHVGLPHGAAVFFGVQHFQLVGVHGSGNGSVEVYLELPFFTFLCGNDDDAVGGAATVNRGGSGILQYLYGFDVTAVQFVHTAFGGYAVDDVERVVVVQRTYAANTDGGTAARITVGRNVHARYTPLHGFHRIVFVLLGYLVHAHYGDGTGKVGLALCGVAGYYYFLQHFRILVHDDGHGCFRFQGQCLVAYIRESDFGARLYGEGEVAVYIRNRSVGFICFIHNGCPDDGVAVGSRSYRSLYLDVLRIDKTA